MSEVEVSVAICNALGIDANRASEVNIKLLPGKAPRVDVVMSIYDEQADDLVSTLEGFDVVARQDQES
tara:strand:+ start:627 stop:830 length:204 start_codon:yes stop_codon:yes gene_type:complete